MLHTSTDYRIFFSLQADQIEVLDLVHKATLKRFSQLAEHGKP